MLTRILAGGLLIMNLSLAANAPVLVELFTSEGCSSCPSADVLLRWLDKEQPVQGADIIVLSEHVDYWNYLGWRDPFSSAEFSKRQQNYARRFNRDGPYTPQMVVNGETEFIGSDAKRAQQAIAAAAKVPAGIAVRLSWSGGSTVRVEADPIASEKFKFAEVFVVVARDAAMSDVSRGENGGRKLEHVSIAGKIMPVGKITPSAGLSKDVPAGAVGERVIVFVQAPDQGKILGAAVLSSIQFRR